MTNTTVGTAVNANANGKVTQSITTVNVGDVIVLWTQTSSTTISMTAASSSHATWTTYGPWTTTGMTMKLALHIGIVTSVATATVTTTPSATIGTVNTQFTGRQFHTDTGNAWTLDTAGTNPQTTGNASASTSMTMPSLTSGGSTRLAVGIMVPENTGTVGATSGYTYRSDDYTSIEAYNLAVSTYAPATATMTSGRYVSAGVLLQAGTSAQTITGTGIASTEAFGTAVVSQQIQGTGVASAEAFGTAVLSQAILATGVGSLEAFGTPAVSQSIAGTAIASTEAFGTAVVANAGYSFFPSSITSAEAFGLAELTTGVHKTYVGETQIVGVFLGDQQASLYVGDTLVFS